MIDEEKAKMLNKELDEKYRIAMDIDAEPLKITKDMLYNSAYCIIHDYINALDNNK